MCLGTHMRERVCVCVLLPLLSIVASIHSANIPSPRTVIRSLSRQNDFEISLPAARQEASKPGLQFSSSSGNGGSSYDCNGSDGSSHLDA